MQTEENKIEEINFVKDKPLDEIISYIEWCFETYPFEAYYSYIHPYLNNPNMRILDMGCANGFLSFWLEKRTKRCIYGMDIAEGFVKAAHVYKTTKGFQSQFMIMDAENSGLKSDSFDLVIMLDVLHHFPDTAYVLKEIQRILKKGGALIVLEPNPFNPLIVYHEIKWGITKVKWRHEHEKHFRRGYYLNSFKKAGFDIVENKTIRYIPKGILRKKHLSQLDHSLSNTPIINLFGFVTYVCGRKI